MDSDTLKEELQLKIVTVSGTVLPDKVITYFSVTLCGHFSWKYVTSKLSRVCCLPSVDSSIISLRGLFKLIHRSPNSIQLRSLPC